MNKKRKNGIIIISTVLVLLLATLGISFAFFNYIKEGKKENSITIGTITFKYTEASEIGNGIKITDAYPTSDEEGKNQIGEGKTFDFKVESTLSRSDLEYEIVASPIEESTLPLDAIKFYLTDITSGTEEEIESTLNSDGSVKTLSEFNDTLIEKATGKTIYQEKILRNTKGYLKEFRARMWINESVDWSDNKYMNKSGAIKINVYANSNRDMAATDTTNPQDTRVERVTANNKYLFTEEKIEEYQYSLTVPNEIETLDISVIPTNMKATVGITEMIGTASSQKTKFNLAVGDNYFKAIVTSGDESEQQEYILKVTREKSNNTNLENLSVEGYTLSPSYANNNNLYEVEVPYEVKSVVINAIKVEDVQTITGLGVKELSVGTNEINITVKAENGTERIIKITVIRKASNDASIANVGVKGYTLTHLEDNVYTITVPYSVDNIEIENISKTDATVNGIGIKENLVTGNNDYEVEVISQSEVNRNEYIIRIIREKDTINTLDSLSLTNCTLSPVFASSTTSYTCTVANSVNSTEVSVTKTSSVATVEGTGVKTLSVGENTINIVVTSQSGASKTYTVKVNRLPNSDATLRSLGVTGQTISPTFNKNVLDYTLTVPYSVDNITITGAASQSVSNVNGLGSKVLNVGENTFNIVVTAEDKTTVKTYKVTVTREQDTDTSLKSIGVTGYNVVKVDDNHYTLTVANSVTSVTVNAEATSSVAIVTGTGNKNLKVGSNEVEIIVTAQNGTISTYVVDITRLASSDATLKGLTVSSGTLSPTFASGTTSYTLSVPYTVTSLTVTPTVNNSEASFVVEGNTDLVVGTNTVTVKVTAGDKTTKTYTITVTRQKDTTPPTNVVVTKNTTTKNSITVTVSCQDNESGVSKIELSKDGGSTYSVYNMNNSIFTDSGIGNGDSSRTKWTRTDIYESDLLVHKQYINTYIDSNFSGFFTAGPYKLTVGQEYTWKIYAKANRNMTLAKMGHEQGGYISNANLTTEWQEFTHTFTATDTYYKAFVIYGSYQEGDIVYTHSLSVTEKDVDNTNAQYQYTFSDLQSGSNYAIKARCTNGSGYTSVSNNTNIATNKDSTATLKSLTVSSGTLSPEFVSATTAYTVSVPYNVSSIDISASATSSVATVAGTGSKTLNVGDNTFNVVVTAQDNTTKTYTITVTREKDTVNTLQSLGVTGYSISPTFASGTKTYTVTTETSSITINATATSNVATVSGTGTKTLNWGNNEFNIIVTSQSGSVNTYKITVINKQPVAPVITGGSSNWVSTAPTITVSTAGSAISNVKHYEYYKSTTNTAPTNATLVNGVQSDGTTPTGTTSGNLTISDEGTRYIWYRTVSNNGFKSAWIGPQVTNLDTINTALDRYEIKNVTATGYDYYVYGVRSPNGVAQVKFPTWTIYGGQDDLKNPWETAAIYDGVNLENGTWMYHVDISDHNNEGGKYITHIYIFDNLGNAVIYGASQIIETANYIGSLYFSDTDAIFNGDRQYCIGDKILSNNFTFEFDAKPTKETPIYPLRTYADTKIDTHNFILMDIYGSGDTAGIGLALGTNGVVAIAHKAGYYYVLLTYTGDLSSQHRYKFTVRNNIPYLYIDGNLVSTGISPLAPASILVTNGCVTGGNYGNYTGYANNFILYNDAR